MKQNEPGEGRHFDDINEIEFALDNKNITLHTKISFRFNTEDGYKKFDTTPGRVLISKELPFGSSTNIVSCSLSSPLNLI